MGGVCSNDRRDGAVSANSLRKRKTSRQSFFGVGTLNSYNTTPKTRRKSSVANDDARRLSAANDNAKRMSVDQPSNPLCSPEATRTANPPTVATAPPPPRASRRQPQSKQPTVAISEESRRDFVPLNVSPADMFTSTSIAQVPSLMTHPSHVAEEAEVTHPSHVAEEAEVTHPSHVAEEAEVTHQRIEACPASPGVSPIRNVDAPVHVHNPSRPQYTMADVSRHNRSNDAWTVVHGKVFDVTSFAERHPGGRDVILRAAGLDATKPFVDNHTGAAVWKALQHYIIGELSR